MFPQKKNPDSYVEVAKANSNRVPSKEQLQDVGLLLKWSKGSGGHGGGGRSRGGCGHGREGGNTNTAMMLKRKGLLDQTDLSHKVMINQANAEQKFETYSIMRGGVHY